VTITEPARVAVVTGGGSGLGRAFVRELLDAGFRVAALGRRSDALRHSLAGAPDARAMVVIADVTDEASVDEAMRQIVDRWGRIDVLVNNAGILGPVGEIDAVSLADVRDTLEVNVMGAVICSRAVFAIMRSQQPSGGRIINNGSFSAHVPRPHSTAYAITKHALTGLTRSLALDGRRFQIAVGQIDIGNAATDMTGFTERALQADGSHRAEATFDAQDAARAVRLMACLPLDANVLSLTLTATTMPFVGRG
jgi:NAD(P)-dependent dehydrogenase (short-subunit alcohol dehydrogenase family)